MSSVVSLVDIVNETKDAFLKAKSDGKLEAGEVVQIGVGVAQKLRGLSQISGGDKKSVVLYCLREGLKAAGGVKELPGLKEAGEAAQKALEEQLLSAASAAIDVAVAVARGKLDWTTVGGAAKSCVPFCRWAAKSVAVAVLPQKDVDVLQKALGAVTAAAGAAAAAAAAPAPPVESSNQESEIKVSVEPGGSELILISQKTTDTTPENTPEKESNQAASPEGAPSPVLEVKFD